MLKFISQGPDNPNPEATIVALAPVPKVTLKLIKEKPEHILNIFPTLAESKPTEYARDPVKCFTDHFMLNQTQECALYKISPQQWLQLFEGKDIQFIKESPHKDVLFAIAVNYGNHHLLENATKSQLKATLTLATAEQNDKTVAALIAHKRDAISAKKWEDALFMVVKLPFGLRIVKLILANCYDKLQPAFTSDSFAVSCQQGKADLPRAFLEKLREEDIQETGKQNDVKYGLENALRAPCSDTLDLLLARPRFKRYFTPELVERTFKGSIYRPEQLPKLQFLAENYNHMISDAVKLQTAIDAAKQGNGPAVQYLLNKYVLVYTRFDRDGIMRELQAANSRKANGGIVVTQSSVYPINDAVLACQTNFLPLSDAKKILAKQTEEYVPEEAEFVLSDEENNEEKKKKDRSAKK